MTQREAYKLEFVWTRSSIADAFEPRVRALRGADLMPTGGAAAYYLEVVLNRHARVPVLEDFITDATRGISHTDTADDSYDLEDGSFLFIYGGRFIVGWEADPSDPANTSIPLTDFRDLLVEWKTFITNKPLGLPRQFLGAVRRAWRGR